MKEVFEVYATDNGLTINFKREANILLASLEEKNDVRYTKVFDDICNTLPLINSLGNMDIQDESEVDDVLLILHSFWNKGILSPLKLIADEFDAHGNNIRCSYIKMSHDIIYNKNAYSVNVRKVYYHNKMEQIDSKPWEQMRNPKLFITKGGVITGEYINDCIIPDKEVKKRHYTLQSIVKLNGSTICIDGKDNIYTIDCRDSKLKALKEFYFVPIKFDEEIAKMKLDIRKYKKL